MLFKERIVNICLDTSPLSGEIKVYEIWLPHHFHLEISYSFYRLGIALHGRKNLAA